MGSPEDEATIKVRISLNNISADKQILIQERKISENIIIYNSIDRIRTDATGQYTLASIKNIGRNTEELSQDQKITSAEIMQTRNENEISQSTFINLMFTQNTHTSTKPN